MEGIMIVLDGVIDTGDLSDESGRRSYTWAMHYELCIWTVTTMLAGDSHIRRR
jgi:hypothetical protein